MTHPFQDKLIVFIGTPTRCTRQKARDALVAAGGVPDERIAAFTDYVVAFNRAEGTKIYQQALDYERNGLTTILTEEQFFDILEGKAELLEKPARDSRVIIIPAKDPEADAREFERIKSNVLNRKRLNNLAKHGVPMLGTRAKIDLRTLDAVNRNMQILGEQD